MKKTFLLVAVLATTFICAQVTPSVVLTTYYSSLEGKSGQQLLDAVHTVAGTGFSGFGYDGLWNAYKKTDLYPADSTEHAGEIWDIYSTCSFPSTQKCGSYSGVCSCYNREHSVPQSWFNEASPMKSDVVHVYPTDGKVNGQRSNYPYGECSAGTNLGGNALGKLGTSTFVAPDGTSYSSVGKVFEPVDEYKGDLARTYFYMVTRYSDKNFTQSSEGAKVFTWQSGKAGFTAYSIALFMKWSRQDAVSDKENYRNNGTQLAQGNRNPFIDLPDLAEYLWGTHAGQVYHVQNPTELPVYELPTKVAEKVIINGHFYIRTEDALYDSYGRKVQ